MSFLENIILPPGTGSTKFLNLPLAHGWMGQVAVSMIAPATLNVSALSFKRDDKVAGIISRTVTPFTLSADTKKVLLLEDYESMMNMTYTCTAYVSIMIVNKRNFSTYESL